jgi:DNA-binding LacI/PurR family transcriptional regulator
VNIRKDLLGSKAVEKLIRLIEGLDSGVEHTVRGVEFVEGDSVQARLC